MNEYDRIFEAAVNAGLTQKPQETPAEALLGFADVADQVREVVEAQRQKLRAEGYPEDLSYSMGAQMWAAMWGAQGGDAA